MSSFFPFRYQVYTIYYLYNFHLKLKGTPYHYSSFLKEENTTDLSHSFSIFKHVAEMSLLIVSILFHFLSILLGEW